ncbi:MAG TPA: hypothetical protein VGB85_16140 [Nannocystis sp.]|jgi:hypothetical protein
MTPIDRCAARHAEIERDHQVVAAALVAGLRRIALDTAADPENVCQRVEDTIAESRAAYRRLNDGRINLRGRRNTPWDDSQDLPAPLVWYRHRGNYHGEFPSMAALGVLLSRAWSVGDDVTDRADAASVAEELHLRGELWTFVHDGVLHVFSKPESPSDAVLARLRAMTKFPATHDSPSKASHSAANEPDPSIDHLTKENVIMITRLTIFHVALVVRVRNPQRLRHRLEVVRGDRRRGKRAVVFQSHQEWLPVARAEGSSS